MRTYRLDGGGLQAKLPKGEALRRAKETLRTKGTVTAVGNPTRGRVQYLWAPFMLVGIRLRSGMALILPGVPRQGIYPGVPIVAPPRPRSTGTCGLPTPGNDAHSSAENSVALSAVLDNHPGAA